MYTCLQTFYTFLVDFLSVHFLRTFPTVMKYERGCSTGLETDCKPVLFLSKIQIDQITIEIITIYNEFIREFELYQDVRESCLVKNNFLNLVLLFLFSNRLRNPFGWRALQQFPLRVSLMVTCSQRVLMPVKNILEDADRTTSTLIRNRMVNQWFLCSEIM